MSRPIVNLDLASLELAYQSLDSKTMQSTDIYRAEAAKMFNVKEEDVTPAQRRYAKQEAYSAIYGRRQP